MLQLKKRIVAALRSAQRRLGKKRAATKSAPGEIVLLRPRKKQFSKGELFARPIGRKDAEPLLRRCKDKIKSAKVSKKVRQNALEQADSYHAFYANWRGDVFGVRKERAEKQRFGENNLTKIFVDLLKPNELPEFYGRVSIEATKYWVEITRTDRVGKDAGGSEARGLFRIALDEALKLRKKGQSITVTAAELSKLVEYYETYGFKFVGHNGVLSAEDIERGYV